LVASVVGTCDTVDVVVVVNVLLGLVVEQNEMSENK
jgi:hypothetical protein